MVTSSMRTAIAQEAIGLPVASAIVVAVLCVFADYLLQDSTFNWRPSLSAAVLGGLLGGLLGIAIEVAKHLRQSLSRLEAVSNTSSSVVALLTELPIAELRSDHQDHLSVVCKLVGDALRNVRVMADVDETRYLQYLEQAIKVSNEYEGIQRFPIRWFEERNASKYLNILREREMTRKVRLFVIDDERKNEMEEDIRNQDLLANYWKLTGSVESYWITASRLSTESLPEIDDCALYDRRLLIRFNADRHILTFQIGKGDKIEDVSRVFSRLRRQIEQNRPLPFQKIPMPARGD
jgi:23S rRNA U2552 (ribose-2'-O)-methylase RlmE/FtsJ